MIFLKKPYIKSSKAKTRLVFDVEIDDNKKKVWFEVENEYKKYLCTDRVDAIFIGLLLFALKNNHDIKSDSFITDDIYYKVVNHLIPSLIKYDNNLHCINIEIKQKPAIQNAGMVGTGCSCGVDSMHAIIKHHKGKIKSYNLTHLCINNVGAFNECYENRGIEKVKKERIKKAKEFANEIGLPIIITDSNFQKEIYQEHSLTHTYSSTFAILCLQKLWKKYYYGSSGIDYSHFSINNNSQSDCSKYELLSLNCFSTNQLQIYSEGGAQDRLEKTKDIYNSKYVKKYLHVCTVEENNCSLCPKCMRTILSLYALNADLNEYKKVFDINYFYKNKNKYYEWIYNENLYNEMIVGAIYNKLLEKDDFKDFVKSKGTPQILPPQPDYYKNEYQKIINSKAYKITNKILIIPRKIIRIIKNQQKNM